MCGLEIPRDPRLLIGLDPPDDAGVYLLTDAIALVQTVDFFTPVVDDPFTFGQIAAANALSDVYAMGATPLCAMNIACFPVERFDIAVLTEILRGGLAKILEAGAVLAGGHTIIDPELKYGLAVTGVAHPERLWAKQGARAGDRLVLTKELGTGIVSTAVKAGLAEPGVASRATASMAALNRVAAEAARDLEVHACTDVTGFGLVGHAMEMIAGTGLGMRVEARALRILPGVAELAAMGLLPAGLHRNRKFRADAMRLAPGLPEHVSDAVCDPQTSGGLLFALPPAQAETLLARLGARSVPAAAIGDIVDDAGETFSLV